MATYTYQQLYGEGIIGENLSGTKTFTFYSGSSDFWNTISENWDSYDVNWNEESLYSNPISSYFTMETIRNYNGYYDLTSPINFSGSYSVSSSMSLVTSSYIASIVVQPGITSFTFTPYSSVTGTTYRLRGTGMYSLTIS
jgi:hypothetical protein